MPERPILVIDDDDAIRLTVVDVLESEGYSVATATNGADGLHVLEQVHPALVLLDMRMPILDGWGFAKALRERGAKVPIVVVTAAHDAHRWAREIDAAAVVAKPFDLTDLLDAVQRYYAPGAA